MVGPLQIKSDAKCPTTTSGQPKFLEDFCQDLQRFIRIAKLAGCSPTFGFLSYSSNPKDEKAGQYVHVFLVKRVTLYIR